MKSATSCSKALFASAAKRSWPVWTAYLVLWVVCLPGYIGSSLGQSWAYTGDTARLTVHHILESAVSFGVIISFCAAICAAMCVFSFMYSPRPASAMGVLPIKREGMFVSQMLAGILPLIAANVLVAVITFCVEAVYGEARLMPIIQWFALTGLQLVLFYGIACFCAQLTGHIIVLPCVYVVLNFTAVVVEQMAARAAEVFIYGVETSVGVSQVFSPVVNMINMGLYTPYDDSAAESYVRLYEQTSFNGWTIMLVYACVGLVLLAAAMLLFRRRRLECAGDVVAVKVLKPVFKYCFAIGGALVLGVTAHAIIFSNSYPDGSLWPLLSLMLMGGFICYFAAEMLMKKTFRVWKVRAWAGFAVFAVVFGGFCAAAEFDIFGYERRVPGAENVESVRIYGVIENIELKNRDSVDAVVSLHRDLIAHKGENERAFADGSYYENPYGVNSFYITYNLKDGRVLQRRYSVAAPLSDVETFESVANLQEAIEWRKTTEIPVTENTVNFAEIYWADAEDEQELEYYGGDSISLTVEEAYELYTECILPDIEDGNLGRIWIITDEDYYSSVYDCSINIELSRQVDGRWQYDSFRTTPTVDSVRTLAWLREHGIEPVLMEYHNKLPAAEAGMSAAIIG